MTHIVPRGYFDMKNQVIALNIVEVIYRQTGGKGETNIPPPHLRRQQLRYNSTQLVCDIILPSVMMTYLKALNI